ncbi:importin-11-like [Hydractinia symbiolongicarpus]|uniref:importin-11-like n=2 Tax=Hydractinia symbiolongicarpus TaxID=13093 RepID=UPI002550858C|nr:importin-11-like [Hydractinia symbiolongicarpus]XP_057306171.1 importin-11-like [Hydractinia symbiolongicarpus]
MSNEDILAVLEGAASQDVHIIKQAEEQLKMWETNTGFYSALLDVFKTKSLNVNVRWMAVLYLKNGIMKYWKRPGITGLSEDEKTIIRRKLIESFDEEISQLAVQLAVIIGKVSRMDIKLWPDVIMHTLQAVRSENMLFRHRALLTLNQIVKELASKRLISDRKVFQEISKNIFEFLAQLSFDSFNKLICPGNVTYSYEIIEMSILLTKVLRKLLIYGATGYSAESIQIKYTQNCLQQVQSLLTIKKECRDIQLKDKYDKYLILLMKILSELQENHSSSFLPILEPALQLCLQQILSSSSNTEFKPMIIHCGNLLRSITRSYKKPKKQIVDLSEEDHIVHSANLTKDKIITRECLENLCHHIMTCYFPLTETDLEEWQSDPEGFMLVEAGESHKFLLGPCMETLFVGLFYEYKNDIVQFLVRYVEKINSFDFTTMSQADILNVSAVYKAVGLASYELFGDLDFDIWFESKLVHLLRQQSSGNALLKHHIVWMIGEWINVKFSKSNRVELYDVLRAILQDDSVDLVLRLTACKTLRCAIDDFDFIVNDFNPFVSSIFMALSKLLVSVQLCDTKMVVLNVLSIMIERIGRKVKTNAEVLLQYLPQLWELSEAHNLLRGAVVNVLVHLVKGLGADSHSLYHITLPVIHLSTSVEQPAHVYLLEDGLELWLTMLRYSKELTVDMLQLYKNLQVLFERASETLDSCLAITKSYLLLDVGMLFKEYGHGLSTVFSELLDYVKEDHASKIVKILILSFQLLPNEFLVMYQNTVLKVLKYTLKDENYPPLMVNYVTLLAHIAFRTPQAFFQLCEVYCKMNCCSYDDVMGRLFDLWLDKVDCMMLQEKKMSALSLSSLLPLKVKFVHERIGLILDLCVNVMYDLQRSGADSVSDHCAVDSLIVDEANTRIGEENEEEDSMEDAKERWLLSQDPIHTIVLLHYVRDKLNETKQSYGDEHFADAISTMDPVVAKQLMTLIS